MFRTAFSLVPVFALADVLLVQSAALTAAAAEAQDAEMKHHDPTHVRPEDIARLVCPTAA
jgi:hypothetical protein